MLHKILEIIKKAEQELGDNAKVSLSVSGGGHLVFRVDWWDDDFHAQQEFQESDLLRDDNDALLSNLIARYKHAYAYEMALRKRDKA